MQQLIDLTSVSTLTQLKFIRHKARAARKAEAHLSWPVATHYTYSYLYTDNYINTNMPKNLTIAVLRCTSNSHESLSQYFHKIIVNVLFDQFHQWDIIDKLRYTCNLLLNKQADISLRSSSGNAFHKEPRVHIKFCSWECVYCLCF